MRSTLKVTGTLVAAALFAIPAQATTIQSTFDTGLDGWTGTGGAFSHVAVGGNPGGYAYLDNCECAIAQIGAPVIFLGNLTGFIGGTLSFDGNLLGAGGSFFDGPNGIPGGVYLDYGIIVITSPTITAKVDLLPGGATAPFQSWQTYSVSMTGSAWGLSTSDFATLMSNVTSLSIVVEALWGPEVQGIDNVRLVSVPTNENGVPLPSSMAIIGLGLFGFGAMRRRKAA